MCGRADAAVGPEGAEISWVLGRVTWERVLPTSGGALGPNLQRVQAGVSRARACPPALEEGLAEAVGGIATTDDVT